MSITTLIYTHWLLLIGCALIPVAPIAAAFILCRADRRHQVRQMHQMRRPQTAK